MVKVCTLSQRLIDQTPPDHIADNIVTPQANEAYDTSHVHAFVHDLTCPAGHATLPTQLQAAPPEFWADPMPDSATTPTAPISTHQVDLISCVFVLSALPPKAQAPAVQALFDVLLPGGVLILRDYALYDEAQLRFHALPSKSYAAVPSLLSTQLDPSTPLAEGVDQDEAGKAWYRRGDGESRLDAVPLAGLWLIVCDIPGTMTYFFSLEEMAALAAGVRGVENGQEWRLEGEPVEIQREMENRREAWGCTRRFVQGSWRKVAC